MPRFWHFGVQSDATKHSSSSRRSRSTREDRAVRKGFPPCKAFGPQKARGEAGTDEQGRQSPYLGEQLLHGVFLPHQLVELLLAVHRAAAPARAGEIFCHVAHGLAFFFKGFPLLELGGRSGRHRRGTHSPCRRGGRPAQLEREGDKGMERGDKGGL